MTGKLNNYYVWNLSTLIISIIDLVNIIIIFTKYVILISTVFLKPLIISIFLNTVLYKIDNFLANMLHFCKA